MADIVFLVFVLYGLVFGMRRGFYKELIAVVALVLGVAAARVLKDPIGDLLKGSMGALGPHTASVLAAIIVWTLVAFVVNLIGRLALRRLRDPDAEGAIEGAAQKAVDASQGGAQKAGPVTYLTNPIASAEKGIIYWSDKILGGALGVTKGVVAGYVLFAVVYYADVLVGAHWSFSSSIESSQATKLYVNYLDASFRSLPEYRLAKNVAVLEGVEQDKTVDAAVLERMAASPRWDGVKATAAFQRIAADPDVQKAWDQRVAGKRDVHALIHLSTVRGLVADPDFRAAFSDVDIEAVRNEAGSAPPPEKK